MEKIATPNALKEEEYICLPTEINTAAIDKNIGVNMRFCGRDFPYKKKCQHAGSSHDIVLRLQGQLQGSILPYLGGDEQVFSLDDAVIEDFLQSNTNLGRGTQEGTDLNQQRCHRKIVNLRWFFGTRFTG